MQHDRVRVQYHDVAVGETTAIPSHPAYVAQGLDAYTEKAILPEGRVIDLTRAAGDVFHLGPVARRPVNTGDTPLHDLVSEREEEEKPPA